MISIYFLPSYLCQCLGRQKAADCFKSPASTERCRLWLRQPALYAISAVTSSASEQVSGARPEGERQALSRAVEVPGFKPSSFIHGYS